MAAPETEGTDEHTLRVGLRKQALKAAGVVLAAVTALVVAYLQAVATGRGQAAEVKDKAESGYQLTREALQKLYDGQQVLLERVERLDAELGAFKRSVRAGRRPPPPVRTPPSPAAPAPAPLPPDLDQALQKVRPAEPAGQPK